MATVRQETLEPEPPRPGTPWWRWAVVLAPGVLLYFTPVAGFTAAQRHLLAVFAATIISLVAQPVPMGVTTLVAVTVLALTRTVPAGRVLSGFSDTTVWLIFTAFLFSRAVTATGLGMRLAYLFIRRFGHSALALGYSVAASGLVLAPFVPSDTARGGGIIYPITRSLALAFGSEPAATPRRLGRFLILVAFHTTYTASAMFLTGMAANPLVADFAMKIAHVELTWTRWALGAGVPGLLAMLLIPWLIYRMDPPEVRDTRAARDLARGELARMGRMTGREKWLVAILLAVMAGWVSSPWHGVPNAFVALGGVSAILLCRVLPWQELLSEAKAWDAFIWFGTLVMMAGNLHESGVISIVSSSVFVHIKGWPWQLSLLALVTAYLYTHYGFASLTAHITALYPSFLAAAVLSGAPPMLAALPLAYFSSLNACLTHYGTGSAPVYFGSGYVNQSTWWKIGFVISLVNLAVWLGLGTPWWRLAGLW